MKELRETSKQGKPTKLVFPYTIEDEPELSRLISTISMDTAKRTARQVLLTLGKIKPMMTKAACQLESGSRRKVDEAHRTGQLKFVVKGHNMMVKREAFEAWMEKDTWLTRRKKEV